MNYFLYNHATCPPTTSMMYMDTYFHSIKTIHLYSFKISSKFKYIHLETNIQSQYWYFQNFSQLVSNAFLFVCTIFNIYSCVLQLIFLVYGILQNLYGILHLNISFIYFKLRYNLLLTHIVHHTCYISTFRLYRTVIMYIIHFVRDVFNLPHLYTSIDISKSPNTTPVINYSYKANNSINPLTTYNYFDIPAITIVVVPVIPILLNDFLF